MSQRDQLTRSWIANASAWSETVRNQQIESRRVATDNAVVAAVLDQHPQRVLDLGCGEGWLARALAARGIDVVGIDASAPLIEAARELGGGTFHVLPFDAVARLGETFEIAVANFALLEEDLGPLLRALPARTLVVQTIHPAFVAGDEPYRDGWRVETFATMSGEWREPMPWYFRTIGSWVRLFAEAEYELMEVREPLHPERGRPLSIVFIARRG